MTRTARHRRPWLAGLGLLLVLGLALGLHVYFARGLVGRDEAGDGELELSSEPPSGGWADPDAGARQEEQRRQEAIELSRREEQGPIRCVLEAMPAATTPGKPEVRVRLVNRSDEAVSLGYDQSILEHVTFLFRDPDGRVVGTFCYLHVLSPFSPRDRRPVPVVTLKPGESDTSTLYLSVASGRNHQRLRPGRYSLEATFQYRDPDGIPAATQGMLARSGRLPVRVVAGAE
jgi:hypothetical protein